MLVGIPNEGTADGEVTVAIVEANDGTASGVLAVAKVGID